MLKEFGPKNSLQKAAELYAAKTFLVQVSSSHENKSGNHMSYVYSELHAIQHHKKYITFSIDTFSGDQNDFLAYARKTLFDARNVPSF